METHFLCLMTYSYWKKILNKKMPLCFSKETATVLRDEGHPYRTRKEAFRQNTMQRMAEVCREYYK